MRLAYRFLAVFLLVVCLSGAVLLVTFDAHRSDVAANANASVTDRADRSASMLDERIREQRRTVSIVAANPDVSAHGTDRQQRALADLVDRSAFDGLSVVDESGEVQWIETTSGNDSALVGDDFSDRRYVQAALDGETYVSDPIEAKTGNDIVVISTPVYDDGDLVGAINGAYHLDVTALFDPLTDEDDDRGAITVEAGDETLFSDADRFEDTISATATLSAVDWSVTAHRDRAAVTTTINRLVLFQVVSGAALLGSITAFGLWVYASKIRRISRLRDRVRALECRKYDDGPSLGGAAEWERIDEALDRLGTTLARREQMLLVLNRILRHNLRNTLNVISGRAKQIEDDAAEPHARSAREIEAASDDLLVLADRARRTETLLDSIDDEVPRVDVAEIVRNRAAGVDGATIEVAAPDAASARCGEELALAIDELFENVVEHAGDEPTATVSVETTADVVRIRVEDDGPGIPIDEAMVITGDRTISQVNHTAGIGLWLVDWTVSRYDGRLLIPSSGVATTDPTAPADDRGGGIVVLELPRATDEA